jgi:hypothetical protein
LEKLGAEVRVGQIFTGPYAGQWVATARYADWESFGKSAQFLSSDPAYQKIVAEGAATFKFRPPDLYRGWLLAELSICQCDPQKKHG